MHGYLLPNGEIDTRRLLEEARTYAAEQQTRPAARKFIYMLSKVVERLADKAGNSAAVAGRSHE